MFFVFVVHQFHARKYNYVLSIVQRGSNLHGAEVMRLGIPKKDEGKGICARENGSCEYEIISMSSNFEFLFELG